MVQPSDFQTQFNHSVCPPHVRSQELEERVQVLVALELLGEITPLLGCGCGSFSEVNITVFQMFEDQLEDFHELYGFI